MIIGAIWRISAEEAKDRWPSSKNLHGGIIIASDSDVTMPIAAETLNNFVIQQFQIGSSSPIGHTHAKLQDLIDQFKDNSWGRVLEDLRDLKLGPPTEGIDNRLTTCKYNQCICEMSILISIGCPSTKGKKCRSKDCQPKKLSFGILS